MHCGTYDEKTKILAMMEKVEITQWYLILINRCSSRRFRPDEEDGVVEVAELLL